MKKYILRITAAVIAAAAVIAVLNMPVTTRQGVDYVLNRKKIPLYLKMLDFLDRHYNYGVLTKNIIKGAATQEERAVKILAWTKQNIKNNPESLPVIDDHVWHIIVRGYGTNDQFQDVFSTLCNYAGIEAFFGRIYSKDRKEAKLLSFAKFKGGWAVFDAYDGVYFMESKGGIACVPDLVNKDWKPVSAAGDKITYDYGPLFDNISSVHFSDWEESRSAIQSPLRRFITWIKGDRRSSARED